MSLKKSHSFCKKNFNQFMVACYWLGVRVMFYCEMFSSRVGLRDLFKWTLLVKICFSPMTYFPVIFSCDIFQCCLCVTFFCNVFLWLFPEPFFSGNFSLCRVSLTFSVIFSSSKIFQWRFPLTFSSLFPWDFFLCRVSLTLSVTFFSL